MERRVTVSLRLSEDLLADVRRVAANEERPLNTQLIRFIRAGLDQHRPAQSSPARAPASDPEALAANVAACQPSTQVGHRLRRRKEGRSE